MNKSYIYFVFILFFFLLLDSKASPYSSIKIIDCKFCSPLNINQFDYLSTRPNQEIQKLLFEAKVYPQISIDTSMKRRLITDKAFFKLKSSQEIFWFIVEQKEYFKDFSLKAEFTSDSVNRTEFVDAIESRLIALLPDSKNQDTRLGPLKYFSSIYLMMIDEIKSIGGEFYLGWEDVKDLIKRCLYIHSKILEFRTLLISDFDLLDLEKDQRLNGKYYKDLFDHHEEWLIATDYHFRIIKLKEAIQYDGLSEKNNKNLLDDLIAQRNLHGKKSYQLDPRNNENEASAELNYLKSISEILYSLFNGVEKYLNIQKLIFKLRQTLDGPLSEKDKILQLSQTLDLIKLNAPQLSPVFDYIELNLKSKIYLDKVVNVKHFSVNLIKYIKDTNILNQQEVDRAKTKSRLYSYEQNIYFYLKGIHEVNFDDLLNPPFQICRKLINQFESNFSTQRRSDQHSSLEQWNSRLASPPETIIYKRMILEKDFSDPGKKQKYLARRFLFLNRCSDQLSSIHYRALSAANSVYELNFYTHKTKPKFSLNNQISIDKLYDVVKVYGYKNRKCKITGFKAFQLRPKIDDNHRVFAFAGTEFNKGSEDETYISQNISSRLSDAKSDLHFGVPQLKSPCAQRLIADAIQVLKSDKDVIFTGHSLGGALAQSVGYLVEDSFQAEERSSHVHIVSWNGFGAEESIKLYTGEDLKKNISERLLGVSYFMESDLVSKMGTHFLETRRLQNKVDISYLKALGEHSLGVMNKSIINVFFEKLDYTYPASPKPNQSIQAVGDFWFNINDWYNRAF